MKIKFPIRFIKVCLPIVVLLAAVVSNTYGQCGTESIAVSPWCENGFAEWTFTSPTSNTMYTWYNYASGPYTYDANGKLIKSGATSISPIDSTTSASYYTPFRVTTAGIAPATSIELTYQKKVSYTNINPYPGATPTFSTGPSGSTFTMNFTTTLTNSVGLRFNYVTVPVVLNTVGKQYKIQVTFGTTAGPGSAIYTFSTAGATNIGGNNYLVQIPVNYTLTTSGAQTLVINTNPAGGTGSPVDGLLYTSTQAPAFSAANNPISIPAASAAAGPSGGFSQIYNWNYSVVCTPQNSGASSKTTTGCCVVPSSLGLLSLSSDKNAIVNGGPVNVTLTVGSGNSSNYFGWYLNGTFVAAASGVGKTSYVTNQTGTWEVREVTNSSDLSNPSCTSNAKATIQDKKIFITNLTSPGHSPLCIGDQWTFSGTGASSLTWSSGNGSLSPTTGTSSTYTATATGTDIISLTGNVPSGNVVVNGDFSINSYSSFSTSMSSSANPTGTDGTSAITSNSLNSGSWSNADWSYNGTKPTVNGNPGNFLIVNGIDNVANKSLVWGQSVTVQPGQTYNFAFDLTSVTYIVSNDPNVGNYTATTPTGTWKDVLIDVYVNGVKIGQASTNFAANGGFAAVGKWVNNSFPWTAGSSVTTAVLELRQASPTTTDGRGYDYGLDNITFGGSVTQTDTYSVGPITDCSTISASASACNGTSSTLTATLTGGLVFDHWEKTSAPGVSVGTTNPLTVTSMTATSYTAFGYLAVGNLLDNGSFSSGGTNGFLSGGNYYSNQTTGFGGGGNNTFAISTTTSNGNAYWSNLTKAPGSTDNYMLAADAKGPVGHPVIGWTINVTAGQKYAFSGWVANQHTDFLSTSGVSTATQTTESANIGVYLTTGAVTNSSYTSSITLSTLKLPNSQAWNNLTANWVAPTTGTYTLYIVDLNGSSGSGNDFVLDNFSLAPAVGTLKSATTTTPVCDPCLKDIPTGSGTFCGNTATVKATPAATEANPTKVAFNWYATAASVPVLGTSVGSGTATLDVSSISVDGSGNKTVYFNKSLLGSGTVFKQSDACDPTFGGTSNTIDAGNISQIEQRYTASTAITLTGMSFNVVTKPYQSNITLAGTITYTVYGSKSYNGGLIADRTVVYGSFTQAYSRAVTTQVDMSQIVSVTGSVAVPAGDFFIVGSITGTSGNGAIVMGKNDCSQAVPKVDDLNGTTVTRSGSASYGNPDGAGNIKMGTSFNVTFGLPATVCPRIAVTLTPNCPCTKPTKVTITAPASKPASICQGTAQTLSGTALVTAASINGGFTYSWFKIAGSGSSTTVPLTTGSVTLPANTTTAVPSNTTAISGLTTDAGTYILRVEDGNAGNSSCYLQDTVILTVNPKPTISSSATGSVCSGIAQNYTITSAVASSYSWSRAAVTNISNAAVAGQSSNPITEALTNTSNAAVNVTYVITPTSTTGSCVGTPFNYVVTVNPTPAVSSSATGSVCSGVAQSYSITSVVPSSYSWSRAAVTNISNAAVAGQSANPITEALTNTSSSAVNVTYVITPTSTTGSCAGTPFNYVVTVNPKPVISSSATGSVCSGVTQNYSITSVVPSSYSWSRATVANISNAAVAGQSANPITEALTNTSSSAVNVTYVITPTSTTGSCAGIPFNYVVTVNPTPAVSSSATGSVCSGVAQNYTITSAVPSSYSWSRAAVANISNAAVAGQSANPITETLTNTSTSPANVTYVITPTSTTGSCAGTPFNYVVTVNPAPAVSSAATGSVCSGIAQNYTITSVVPSSYSWSRAAVANISNAAVAGQSANPITEALTNTSSSSVNVTYVITPTSTTGSCVGAPFNYVVTVNPKPVISSSATGSVCSGVAQSYSITSAVPSSYSWSRAAVTNISNAAVAGQSANPITEALTNTSSSAVNVTYVITPTSTTGSCAGTPFNYVVTVNPTPAITSSAIGTVCSGVAQNYAVTSNVASSYAWTRAVVAGISNGAGSGSSDPITEILTNTTAAAVNVTYVITPTSTTGSCVGAPFNYVVTVNPSLPVSVSIATPSTTICSGTSVTFTATPTNGGTTPTYQWKLNGVNIPAATNSTYTTTTVANNDSYTVVLTSNATCPTGNPATSNAIVMTVTTIVTPAVSITANPGSTICAGASVTFTASPGNGGSAPTYQWFNGATSIAGATNDTYASSTLASGDKISVVMTSNSSCVVAPGTATSNVITMTVNPIPSPSVSALADKTSICPNDQITFTATPTQGGSNPLYQWYKGGVAIGGATNGTFVTTGAANGDVYTVGMTSNATCAPAGAVTSPAITITVTPVPSISVSIVQDITSICANNPVKFTATASGSGADASTTYEWFIAPTTVTPTGGTSQGAPSTSANPYSISTLTPTKNSVYVKVVSHAQCATAASTALSNVLTTTVNSGITAGSIGSDQSLCYNGTASTITQLTTSSATTPTYVWESSSSSSGPFTAIGGATNVTYTPPANLTADVYYHRIVTDGSAPAPCNVATSNVVHITVYADLTAGSIGSVPGICSGQTPAQISNATSPTGGTGSYTYTWDSSTDGGATWTTVSGAGSSTYSPAALTTTTQYRRNVTSGSCGTLSSAATTVNVTANSPVSVSINNPGPTCSGAAMAFTAIPVNEGTTPSYQWYVNTTAVGTNSASYSNSTLANGDVVKVVLTSSLTCKTGSPATSNTVTVSVLSSVTPAVTISNPGTVCAGTNVSFVATGSGGGSTPSYQWYLNGVPSGTNSATYSNNPISNGDQVYVVMTSSLGCAIGGPATSNTVTMNILAAPNPSIVGPDTTICSGQSKKFTVVGGNGTFTWLRNGSVISGATSKTYTASTSGTYKVIENNGACVDTSSGVILTVVPTPVANAGDDIYLEEGQSASLNASGGALYSWTPSTGLSNPNVSNPSFVGQNNIAYTVTVTDPSGTCSSSDEVDVFVEKQIVIPNAITANNDGNNDTWEIKNIESFPNCQVDIYSRWGTLVYTSKGYLKQWDGSNFRNGEILPDGTYYYVITLNGRVFVSPYKGFVQLIR